MKIFRPSEEDQTACREHAESRDLLPVTVLHGTHSCSIHCFGADQKAADDQAAYILELQKDAERYRWLRDVGQDTVEVFFSTDNNASGWGCWDSWDDKDAAIDDAMARTHKTRSRRQK